ncbi:hypothetical protein ACVBEF_04405 [Glaciimonas sp. GG7]
MPYLRPTGLAKRVGQFVTQGQRIEVVKPMMRDFAARFEVTVTLWRPIDSDRIVLVSSALSPTNLSIDITEHKRRNCKDQHPPVVSWIGEAVTTILVPQTSRDIIKKS